ncbi:hypothetical protein D3C80_1849390 [compost metagenome]
MLVAAKLDHRQAAVDQCRAHHVDESVVDCVILFHIDRIGDLHLLDHLQHRAEVKLPDAGGMIEKVKKVAASPRFAQGPEAERRKDFARFMRDVQ